MAEKGFDYIYTNEETLNDVARRVVAAIDVILLNSSQTDLPLVVLHQTIIGLLLWKLQLIQNPLNFKMPNTAILKLTKNNNTYKIN
jgi:broad specificity phosphatase PhoE